MGRVAALGCALCRRLGYEDTPAQVHHIRTGVAKGKRASDYLTIPLCPEHHTGSGGFHGKRTAFKLAQCGELDLLGDVICALMNE